MTNNNKEVEDKCGGDGEGGGGENYDQEKEDEKENATKRSIHIK